MIKGTVYLVLIAILIFACVVGEIMYRIECKKLEEKSLNPKFFTTRLKTYPLAVLIGVGIVALIAVIVEMINTWNDPI